MKEELTRERDEQLTEIVKLREQLAEETEKEQQLETEQEEANLKIQEVGDNSWTLKLCWYNYNCLIFLMLLGEISILVFALTAKMSVFREFQTFEMLIYPV